MFIVVLLIQRGDQSGRHRGVWKIEVPGLIKSIRGGCCTLPLATTRVLKWKLAWGVRMHDFARGGLAKSNSVLLSKFLYREGAGES